MFTAFIIAIEILAALLLQTAVFPYLEIAGIAPDLMMIVTVAAGYQKGRLPGMFTGLACGLLLDVTSSGVLGVYALFFLFIGYLNGLAKEYYVVNDTFLPLLLLAISELAFSALVYVFEFLIRGKLNVLFYLRRIMFPRVLYTVVAGIVLYKILDLIYRYLIVRHQEKQQAQQP